MIRRSLGYRAPASVSINLYKALIQPIIGYSAPVWSPFTKIQIVWIEQIYEILLDIHFIIQQLITRSAVNI